MAGESPGKSEQRKSSGETTASERDPRLAVFRAAEADDTPSDGTDTDAVIPPPAEEDARLREAVSARVSSPSSSAGDATSGRAGAADWAASDKAAADDADPSTPASDEAGSGAATRGDEAGEPASDAARDGRASAGTPSGGTSTAEAEPTEAATGAAREGAAPAGTSPAESENGEAASDAAGSADPTRSGKASAGTPSGEMGNADAASAEAATGVARDDEAPAGTPSGETGNAGEASAEAATGVARDDEAPAATPSGETGRGGADSAEAATDGKVSAGSAAGAARDDEAPAGASSGDAGRGGADSADGDGDGEGAPDAAPAAPRESPDTLVVGNKAATGALAASEGVSEGEVGSRGSDAGEGRQEGEGGVDRSTAVFKALKQPSDEPRVDQPTAVFKALKQPEAEPAVDQPTTALKLPARGDSTFVPLKRDDQPAAAAKPPVPAAEQTRQQPLPPKPPLDLLAELTNTPPPPQTPVRTAFRRVKIWTPLVVLLLIVFAVVQAVRPLPAPTLELTAQPTFSFGGKKPTLPWPGEGQGYMVANGLGTMDSFGEQKAVPIGSVAKAMTAYLVLKDHPLKPKQDGPSVPVDAKAESDGQLFTEDESTLDTVKAGDKLSLRDSLSALMIPSANNIARLLARWDAGSEKAFVTKMNETAKELGMTDTTYTDPSGLIATTVSTSEDQVKLGQKLVEIPALMDITKLPSWTDPSGKTWRNYNTLVPYNGALGIKTGTTTKAGGCLLFAAHKMVGGTDQLIVGAVLGQHKAPIIDTVNTVSKTAMIGAQDELESKKIVRKGQVVGNVDDGMGGSVPVVATKDVDAVGWSGLTVKLDLAASGTLPHAAAAGTHVGTLSVGEGASQVKVAVALKSDLVEPGFGSKLTRVG